MFSRIVSYALHPSLMPTIGMAVLLSIDSSLKYIVLPQMKIYIYLMLIINTMLLPGLIVLLMKYRGMISSMHLSKRKDRVLPFGISVLFYAFSYSLMRDTAIPNFIISVFLGITIAVVVSFLLTLWTKLSIHMVGITGLLASIMSLSVQFSTDHRFEIIAIALVWGIVGYARIESKAHTLNQVLLGSAVGFACVFFTSVYGITI